MRADPECSLLPRPPRRRGPASRQGTREEESRGTEPEEEGGGHRHLVLRPMHHGRSPPRSAEEADEDPAVDRPAEDI